jgi:hypothetical protein
MSNIAPPVPKMLKRRDRGKGLYNTRLENDRRLLRWALEYLQTATDDLQRSHQLSNGTILGGEIQVEIRRCRKWIALARTQVAP